MTLDQSITIANSLDSIVWSTAELRKAMHCLEDSADFAYGRGFRDFASYYRIRAQSIYNVLKAKESL